MGHVTIRELGIRGGEVESRAMAGKRPTVPRDGRPVAELLPLPWLGLDAATLFERWKHVPVVDPEALCRDVDEFIEASL